MANQCNKTSETRPNCISCRSLTSGCHWQLTPFPGPLTRYLYCGLRMRLECREHFPRHPLQRKPLVTDPGMHQGTCDTHMPWCMSGSLTRGGGENVPDIPGACANRNFTYMARGSWHTRTCLSSTLNISFADDLATQGAMVSTATVSI